MLWTAVWCNAGDVCNVFVLVVGWCNAGYACNAPMLVAVMYESCASSGEVLRYEPLVDDSEEIYGLWWMVWA